jgi:NADH-quinone oxidoreductase subunit C
MLIEKLKERFGTDIVESGVAHGDETVVVERERALEIMRALRDDPEFSCEFLIDVTAVDWPGRKPRFDVVYHLKSISRSHRIRVKVRVDSDDAWVESATGIWKSADWLERECYDMFGVTFKGHPDLRRILLYDSFVGHPLRKDYPYQKRQPVVPETDPIVHPLRPSK